MKKFFRMAALVLLSIFPITALLDRANEEDKPSGSDRMIR